MKAKVKGRRMESKEKLSRRKEKVFVRRKNKQNAARREKKGEIQAKAKMEEGWKVKKC